jgi:hypothetical protein
VLYVTVTAVTLVELQVMVTDATSPGLVHTGFFVAVAATVGAGTAATPPPLATTLGPGELVVVVARNGGRDGGVTELVGVGAACSTVDGGGAEAGESTLESEVGGATVAGAVVATSLVRSLSEVGLVVRVASCSGPPACARVASNAPAIAATSPTAAAARMS